MALCGDGLEAEYARVGSSPYFFVKGSPSREKEICHIRQTRVHGTTARGDEVLFDLAFTWIDPVQSLVDAYRVSFVVRLFFFGFCVCCDPLSLLCVTRAHSLQSPLFTTSIISNIIHFPLSLWATSFFSFPLPPSVSFVRESLSEGQTYLYKMCSAYSV